MEHEGLDVLEADELTALARLDMEANRLDDALIKLKRAVSLGAPGESRAMLGRLYARLGLFDRAKDMLAKYVEAHPDAFISRFQHAMVCLDMGDLDAASHLLDQVLAQEPEYPPALYHKALIFARTDKKGEALNTLALLLTSASSDNLFYSQGTQLKAELEGGVDSGNVERVATAH